MAAGCACATIATVSHVHLTTVIGARRTMALLGISVGITSIWLAWRSPAFSLAGTSVIATAVEITVGWGTLAVGMAAWQHRPRSDFGPILAVAGIAWFLVEWPNPASAGSLVFSVGLLLRAAYPALVGHAALAFPAGRLGRLDVRLIVAAAYLTNVVALGVIPALFFDPRSTSCLGCPDNIFSVGSNLDLTKSVTRIAFALEAAWGVAAIAEAVHRLVRGTPSFRRLVAPVLVPAVAFFVCVVLEALHAYPRASQSNDAVDLALWYGEAAAMIGLASGVGLEQLRNRRARQKVALVALELAGAPPTGQLRDALGAALGDPSVRLAYAVGAGRFSDSEGRPIEAVQEPGRTDTEIIRGSEVIAIVSHRNDLVEDPERLQEVIRAARLSVENERVRAETKTQLADLRASRARIVDSGTRARRRLERDLHDGAQQRLVTLSMAVSLVRLRLGDDRNNPSPSALNEAEDALREALAELREIAHGIYPAELADGLAPGLAALAEDAAIAIQLLAIPEIRFEPQYEAAAYFLIIEAIFRPGVTRAWVNVECGAGRLLIDVDTNGPPPISSATLEDQAGAMNGIVTIVPLPSDLIRIHAEIPCV